MLHYLTWVVHYLTWVLHYLKHPASLPDLGASLPDLGGSILGKPQIATATIYYSRAAEAQYALARTKEYKVMGEKLIISGQEYFHMLRGVASTEAVASVFLQS